MIDEHNSALGCHMLFILSSFLKCIRCETYALCLAEE